MCYTENKADCEDPLILSWLGLVSQDFIPCIAPPAPVVTDEEKETCPSVLNDTISFDSMSSGVVSLESPPRLECSVPQVSHLRQCSLFMDSQLRAFASYRNGLETCSLPGVWRLFSHPSLSIEVEGASSDSDSNHTRLTLINVTFHDHECNPTVRTYTAYNLEPLPSDFEPATSDNSTNPLQIVPGEDGTVVTLMAIWLNTTIIIRQYAEFLSITLQVPREMSLESDGLCTGCPPHQYIDILSISEAYSSLCEEVNRRVLNFCFDHGGVANNRLINVQNNSYLEACVFSLFKIERTVDVLAMFNAIADDAKLLVNIGEEPTTPPTPDPDFSYTGGGGGGDESTTMLVDVTTSTALPSQARCSTLTLITILLAFCSF